MIIEKIFFEATDGVELFGLLHLPENKRANVVVIAVHGHSSNAVAHNRDNEIARTLTQNGFAYFCFNNRGSDIVRKLKINENGKIKRTLGGSAYDLITDCYHDAIGAILAMQNFGFDKFILQGHSLGCSKLLITFEELLKNDEDNLLSKILGYIFLSPVDSQKYIVDANKEFAEKIYNNAKELADSGKENNIIENAILDSPASAKVVLNLFDNIQKISIQTETDGGNFDRLENIKKPILVCYGERDYTTTPTKVILEKFKNNLTNPKNMFEIIEGGNHSYNAKEDELANVIANFCKSF